jgi:hypothetical protein
MGGGAKTQVVKVFSNFSVGHCTVVYQPRTSTIYHNVPFPDAPMFTVLAVASASYILYVQERVESVDIRQHCTSLPLITDVPLVGLVNRYMYYGIVLKLQISWKRIDQTARYLEIFGDIWSMSIGKWH